jgi:hypothetical protein
MGLKRNVELKRTHRAIIGAQADKEICASRFSGSYATFMRRGNAPQAGKRRMDAGGRLGFVGKTDRFAKFPVPPVGCLATIPADSAVKTYIPELSELRMVHRAPDRPIDFGADRDYIFSCLDAVEQSFGLDGFPGLARERIPARALINQLILWWRTLEPANHDQQDAFARMPGAIRLIDTVSTWLAERAEKPSESTSP